MIAETSCSPARLDNALCNALIAIQDNYTYDALEQASMVREIVSANTVDEMVEKLESFDIKGYDLDSPNVGCRLTPAS